MPSIFFEVKESFLVPDGASRLEEESAEVKKQ